MEAICFGGFHEGCDAVKQPVTAGGRQRLDRAFAATARDSVYADAEIAFDASTPHDSPKQLLEEVSKLSDLGWKALTDLGDGLEQTYRWYTRYYMASVRFVLSLGRV